MKRADAKRHDSHKPAPTQPAVPIGATDREIQLSLDRDELLGLMQDSLENLALKLGTPRPWPRPYSAAWSAA